MTTRSMNEYFMRKEMCYTLYVIMTRTERRYHRSNQIPHEYSSWMSDPNQKLKTV